jgi:glycosyltransferase involved in cell wall biosynthesis
MSNGKPRVSIGMPVYNGENFIKEALDSIIAQSFEDFELIISDNASNDSTEEICREYAVQDRRLCYYRNEQNIGAARNFNRVFELSGGEYFKWFAHDDVCAPEFLAKCVRVLDSDESVVLCHAKTREINEYGDLLNLPFSRAEQTNSFDIKQRFRDILLNCQCCFEVFGLIRAEALSQTSLIAKYWSSDRILLAELSLMGRFHEIKEELFFRRKHFAQSTELTVNEAGVWIDPLARLQIPFQAQALNGYVSGIWKSSLTYSQKLQCYLIVGEWAMKRLALKFQRSNSSSPMAESA